MAQHLLTSVGQMTGPFYFMGMINATTNECIQVANVGVARDANARHGTAMVQSNTTGGSLAPGADAIVDADQYVFQRKLYSNVSMTPESTSLLS